MEKQMEKKFLGLGMLLVMSLFLLPGVMAAAILVSPTASTFHSGTMSFTCNTSLISSAVESNASLMYNVTGGVTGTSLIVVSNTSADQVEFSDTAVDVSSLTDASTYNMSCYVDNGTDQEWSPAVGSITIDNTAPVISLVVQLSGETQSYGGILDYSCQLSDAIDGTLTTQSFTVTHPTGDEISSTTLTRNKVTSLQFTDTDYPGDYVFTCSATDASGNTASSSKTVTVDDLGRLVKVSGGNGTGNNLLIYAVIIGLAIWYFTKK